MRITKEDAQIIDEILQYISENKEFRISREKYNDEYTLSQYLLCASYIKENSLAIVLFYIGDEASILNITEKGTVLINRGGLAKEYESQENERNAEAKIRELTEKNLEYQNNELEYRKRIRKQENVIRYWQLFGVAIGIIGFIGWLLFIFNLF